MSTQLPHLIVQGDMQISSPTDDFIVKGDETELVLTGTSLRAFLRLRRHASQTLLPPWMLDLVTKLRGRSQLVLKCRCRGRDIATVHTERNGLKIHLRPQGVLRAALRL